MKPGKGKLKSAGSIPTTTKGVALMLLDPIKGVAVKDRKYHLKVYRCCFVGELTRDKGAERKMVIDWFG